MKVLPWSEKVWFTPRFAINYFETLARNLGGLVTTSSKFQKEREAWIMGVTLLGVNKLTGVNWWLQVPKKDPPDIECMFMQAQGDFNMLNYRHVEVMEITKYNKGTVKNEISKKLLNKSYGKEYALLVYLRREEFFPDLRAVAKEMTDIKPKIADIWCLANTKPDEDEYILFRLYPDFHIENFSITEEVQKIPKGDFLTLVKSKGTKMIKEKTDTPHEFIPSKKGSGFDPKEKGLVSKLTKQ